MSPRRKAKILFLASTARDPKDAKPENSLVVVHITAEGAKAYWLGQRLTCIVEERGAPITSPLGEHSTYTLTFPGRQLVLLYPCDNTMVFNDRQLTNHLLPETYAEYDPTTGRLAF